MLARIRLSHWVGRCTPVSLPTPWFRSRYDFSFALLQDVPANLALIVCARHLGHALRREICVCKDSHGGRLTDFGFAGFLRIAAELAGVSPAWPFELLHLQYAFLVLSHLLVASMLLVWPTFAQGFRRSGLFG